MSIERGSSSWECKRRNSKQRLIKHVLKPANMVNVLLQVVIRYGFIFVLAGLYVWVLIKGRKEIPEVIGRRAESLDRALDDVGIGMRQFEAQSREKYKVPLDVSRIDKAKAGAIWIDLWPRDSLFHRMVKPMTHPSDSFSLTMNFGKEKVVWPPSMTLEIIPYKKKMMISKYFDYLVQLDDIETGIPEIDDNFLIKTNDLRNVKSYFRRASVLEAFNDIKEYLEYFTIRPEEPHLECKFRFPKTKNELKTMLTFTITLVDLFARPRRGGQKRAKVRKPTN